MPRRFSIERQKGFAAGDSEIGLSGQCPRQHRPRNPLFSRHSGLVPEPQQLRHKGYGGRAIFDNRCMQPVQSTRKLGNPPRRAWLFLYKNRPHHLEIHRLAPRELHALSTHHLLACPLGLLW